MWNDAQQAWIGKQKIVSMRGKPATRLKPLALALAGALSASPALSESPNTLPTGGQVVAGAASIQQAGNQLKINQTSDKAILNWNTFNIGGSAGVTFNQPSNQSVTLNRVLSSDPSSIQGRLAANGQVFLINPSGIVLGPDAKIDVQGLVASTLDIKNEDFLRGNNHFTRNDATGDVVNQGEINASYVALLAPEVRNAGIITANLGTVVLAGGEAVTLNLTGQSLVDVQVDKASINTLIENKHIIQTNGGKVILSAQSANGLLGAVVNTGLVEANGITTDGGVIRITASSNIDLAGSISASAKINGNGGTITAIADLTNPDSQTTVGGMLNAQGGSASGNGGFIETSGRHLSVKDGVQISTQASGGKAGQWLLDPNDFTIAASGGDITGATLTTALATTDVSITTAAGNASCSGATGCPLSGTAGNGDINVNDPIAIGPGHILTLTAYRNINFNAVIDVDSNSSTRLYLWYGMQGASQPGAYVVNSAGGTTGAGGNIKGGDFNTESAHTYPVLGNLSYVAPAPPPPPPDPIAYVRLTNSSPSSLYGSSPTLLYDYFDSAGGGNALSLTPTSGSISWSTPITATTNAGPYSLSYTGNFALSGYNIQPGNAVQWTINPRPLNVTVSKTYDGTGTINSGFILSGMVNGNAAPTVTGTAAVNSANAATYSAFSSGNLALSSGNYTLTGGTVAATINPKPLSLTATKSYDLSNSAVFAYTAFTLSGQVGADSLPKLTAGTATVKSPNVGVYTAFESNTLTLNDPNYTVNGATIAAQITKMNVTLVPNAVQAVQGHPPTEYSYSVVIPINLFNVAYEYPAPASVLNASVPGLITGAPFIANPWYNAATPPGAYDMYISPGTVASENLNFSYKVGTLNVYAMPSTSDLVAWALGTIRHDNYDNFYSKTISNNTPLTATQLQNAVKQMTSTQGYIARAGTQSAGLLKLTTETLFGSVKTQLATHCPPCTISQDQLSVWINGG